MMNLNFRKIAGLTVASSFLWITSCRTSDTDHNLVNSGPVAVKINFKGDAYDEDMDPKAATRSMVAEKTTVMLDPSTYVNVEMVPNNTPKTRTARGLLNMSMLRVMAYETATMKYKDHQDYFVNQGNALGGKPLVLDGGTTYAIIAYSYGSTANLPDFTEDDKSKLLYQVVLDYDYTDPKYRDFMYFIKTDFTPVGGDPSNVNNTLPILLKHRLVSLTAKLNTPGAAIRGVKNFSITPHSKTSKIYLVDGSFNTPGPAVGAMNDITYTNLNSANVTSAPVLINGDTGGQKIGAFEATINIEGTEKDITTKPFFSIKRGTKKNLNIDFNITGGKCGAFLGPNKTDWRDFACYNVHAIENGNPFTPHSDLQGAKFKWGNKNSIGWGSAYYNKNDDTNAVLPQPPGEVALGGAWNDGRGPQDPCESGYQVTSMTEFQNLFKYNTPDKVGTWSNGLYDNEMTGGYMFGDKLMLPAAGYRSFAKGSDYDKGLIKERGWVMYYWTGSYYSDQSSKYGGLFSVNRSGTSWFGWTRTDQTSTPIRCIKMKSK